MQKSTPSPRPGLPHPMGASLATDPSDGTPGVNFAVHASEALAVEVVLPGHTQGVQLQPVGQDLWCAFVPHLGAGQAYHLRVLRGAAATGPAPLLMDPWAHGLLGTTTQLSQLSHLGACTDPAHPAEPPFTDFAAGADHPVALPHSLVVDLEAERAAGAQSRQAAAPPTVPPARTVLLEAHVKALTRLHPGVPEALRGTYAGLACAPVLDHLRTLGITTVCLLPVHQAITERHLLDKGLTNHWGYNPLNVFTPDPRLAACTRGQAPTTAEQAAAVRAEFRAMVQALHAAGMEVILDVVFNHTAEGDATGPLLSWRGLAPTHWYAHGPQGQLHNFSGCGNSLNLGHPLAVHWVMDSLRWWVQAYGVDGFRFDLATSLGRQGADHRYSPQSPLLSAMAQDPTLAHVRLVAEPWDLGPDGYQLGQFPPRWQEWNDRFRDTTRAFWLGHPCTPGGLARVLLASSDRFQRQHKRPLDSINLITAHDGYTLADLTAYTQRHNLANGEDNRDGHGHNLSANAGTEGPSTDPTTLAQRDRWQRALLATLLLAQGTPQLLAGDEQGHSQHGNNNAYCQDNPTTWLAWPTSDLTPWVAGLAALRARYPGLRHPHWFTGHPAALWPSDPTCPLHDPAEAKAEVPDPEPAPWQTDDTAAQRAQCAKTCPVLCPWAAERLDPDVTWRDLDGSPMTPHRWNDPQQRSLACTITVGEPGQPPTERLLLALNASPEARPLTLPPGPWRCVLDSARHQLDSGPPAPHTDNSGGTEHSEHTGHSIHAVACTVLLLVQPLRTDAPMPPRGAD